MRLLCTIICLCLILASSCTSRRLEYQQLSQNTAKTLTNIPENSSLGNSLQLPATTKSAYSFTPYDKNTLIPRPTATFIHYSDATSDSILLRQHMMSSDDFVRVARDSRFRPAMGTALPIEHVDKELKTFLQINKTAYQKVDPETMDMTECAILYRLELGENLLFLCLQMTLESVYVASQAEDSTDKSLDEEGIALLKQFSQALL